MESYPKREGAARALKATWNPNPWGIHVSRRKKRSGDRVGQPFPQDGNQVEPGKDPMAHGELGITHGPHFLPPMMGHPPSREQKQPLMPFPPVVQAPQIFPPRFGPPFAHPGMVGQMPRFAGPMAHLGFMVPPAGAMPQFGGPMAHVGALHQQAGTFGPMAGAMGQPGSMGQPGGPMDPPPGYNSLPGNCVGFAQGNGAGMQGFNAVPSSMMFAGPMMGQGMQAGPVLFQQVQPGPQVPAGIYSYPTPPRFSAFPHQMYVPVIPDGGVEVVDANGGVEFESVCDEDEAGRRRTTSFTYGEEEKLTGEVPKIDELKDINWPPAAILSGAFEAEVNLKIGLFTRPGLTGKRVITGGRVAIVKEGDGDDIRAMEGRDFTVWREFEPNRRAFMILRIEPAKKGEPPVAQTFELPGYNGEDGGFTGTELFQCVAGMLDHLSVKEKLAGAEEEAAGAAEEDVVGSDGTNDEEGEIAGGEIDEAENDAVVEGEQPTANDA